MIKEFKNMIGRTMINCVGYEVNSDIMSFVDGDGNRYSFSHSQDCCENVGIYDVIGDISDLIGSPMLGAEEISSPEPSDYHPSDSYTWTFYRFWTAKGTVTVRWLGESNGYYSEGVDYVELM